MISMHLPNEAYQLAAEHELGQPIRVYRTTKRPQFKIVGWATAITYLIIIIVVLTQIPFHFTHTTIFLYSIFVAIMFVVALFLFVPLLLIRKTTVHICSSGFILHHKTTYQIVRWEDVEWVLLNNGRCIVYLANKERVILSQLIGHLETLAQEIELKARLIKRPEGRETLEVQFEHLLNSQAAREQEKYDHFQGKQRLIEKETPEEALRLQEEYRLGEVVATYYGGFKGILRRKTVGLSIHYLLLLAFAFLFIEEFFHFRFIPGGFFLASNTAPLFMVLFLLSSLFMPRFSARFLRLHLYTEGFIYIDGSSFDVVRWEQIEKVIYHKTMPAFSPPFCHIYLTNDDKLLVSGYIHERSVVKQAFNEHVVNKVQVG
jgi:hypothetical protein